MSVKRACFVLRKRTQRIQRCRFLAFSGYAIVIQPDESPVIDQIRKATHVKSAALRGDLRYG